MHWPHYKNPKVLPEVLEIKNFTAYRLMCRAKEKCENPNIWLS